MPDTSTSRWTGAPLAHQPVRDADGTVTAYTVHGVAARVPSQRHTAVSAVDDPESQLDAEYENTDLHAVSGGRPLLLEATRRVLTGDDEDVVAQVPGMSAGRPQVAGMVAWRYARGLPSALSGFRGSEPEVALLPQVRMVGIDSALDAERAGRLIDLAHEYGVTVIAEHVHTAQAQTQAFANGADLVEGRLLPSGVLERGGLAASELSCLELISMLAEEDVDNDAVTGLVAADPNLAVGVLHLVNSAVFALPRRVDSVRQAVALVGPRLLWAVASTALGQAGRSDVDSLWHLLSRALATWELSGDDAGYTVGLLSGVADLRQVDPQWLAGMAGLSEQTTAALLGCSGTVGQALAAVRAHEYGEVVALPGLDPVAVSRAWLGALPEALAIASALSGAR